MALAALRDYEFPYKCMNQDEAGRKIFRKLSRNISDEDLLNLDEAFFNFKHNLPCLLTELPKFIVKALCKSNLTNKDIITLAAFSYLNNIDASVFTDLLDFKYDTAEEEFNEALSDFESHTEGDIIRNVTITHSITQRYRVNLNNVPIWLVDFARDKENVPPLN